MATDDLTSIDQLMAEFKGPLAEQLEALEARRRELVESHRAELAELDSEIVRHRRVLRAAFPDEFSGQTSSSSSSEKKNEGYANHGGTIPPEKLDQIRKFVIRHLRENDSISQVEVRMALGFDSGSTSTGFRELRAEGLLRQSGQVGNRKFYKLTKDAEEALNTEGEG